MEELTHFILHPHTLYKKLETFHSDNEEINLTNAATILTCFNDIIDREDFECFHRLEQVYLAYGVKHAELNQVFKALQQIVSLMEKGKVHKVISLYLEEQWTKEIREQVGKLIIEEAEQIRESLDIIKKEASEYWKLETELVDLEKLVNENLKASKEFNSLSNDRTISSYMKKMMECIILLDGFVAFEDMKDEFIDARDSFFEKEDRGKFQHTLRKMEEYYPICYKLFADIFFDGKSTDELINNSEQNPYSTNTQRNRRIPNFPNAKEGYEHKPYIEGFLELLFIVIGTCCFPPALPLIFICKYYARHQKSILKVVKRVLVVIIPLLLVAGIYAVSSYIREKKYEESHNNVLTDAELEKIEQLENMYAKKAGVDIIYIQSEESQVEVDGSYILLSYYINHPVWDSGYGIHTRGILTQEQTDELGSEIYDMLDDESLSDYEKCEMFFEIAYDYIVKNNISPQGYIENMQNKENLNSFSITQDGMYDVGYGEKLINPGSYEVKAGGDIDNQFSMVYITVYRNGKFSGVCTVGSFPISITLREGDALDVSYSGRGSYNLVLNENEPSSERDEDNQITTNTEDDIGLSEEENPLGEWNIYLEDLYEILSNDYTFEQVKNKYPTGILTEADNYLLEYYGYFGEYHGYFQYGIDTPVYGLAGEHTNFGWTSDFGTICSDEYINQLYNLQYIDSGYHNDAKVTIYNWENKLIVTVLQSDKNVSTHTLVQVVLYDEKLEISYW